MSTHSRRVVAIAVVSLVAHVSTSHGRPGDLYGYLPACAVAPQDFALDRDGTYWGAHFLENKICHYGPGLREHLETLDYPIPGSYPTGIAYNPLGDTLFVTDALSGKITEIEKDGTPTGLVIIPAFLPLAGASGPPSIRGMAFDPTGNGGSGSVYFVEAEGTLIYEVDLEGNVIRTITHPDDPDGYPGNGQSAPASDVDLIYDAGRTRVVGLYVTGGRGRITHLRRLEADGSYQGVSTPLADSGGTVSGFLRTPFERPDTGAVADSYVCVVESNARFAVLEGGEPILRDVTGFSCEPVGREVHMTWARHQEYDRFEVAQGCKIIATLEGTATEWRHSFDSHGVYELTLRAFLEGESPPTFSCTAVVGAGEVLKAADVGGELPVDIATDSEGLLLLTDARARKILLRDLAFKPAGEIELSDAFAGEKDTVTGIAFAKESQQIFVFNATQSAVGLFDDLGALVVTFPALLPNLEEDPAEEPDYGFVLGMTFDASGDGGRGSLWVVETNRDWIYEISVAEGTRGAVLRSFPHPYIAVEPPPEGSPFGISTSGIAMVAGGSPDEMFLTGGALRDLRQPHIFRVDKRTGEMIPGSAIPTDGIRAAAGTTFITLETLVEGGAMRLLALSIGGKSSKILDVRHELPPVPAPLFLRATQPGFADEVLLRFLPAGPYDAVEVQRDCIQIAELPGDATSYLDPTATAGYHEYAVRGVRGGVASDFVRASAQLGIGAVLKRAFVWPARSPQQLAQDPTDGSFAVAVNWPREERNVYHYDRSLHYQKTRVSVVREGWEIAAIAIRALRGGDRELNYITWQQPVPIGDVASQRFFLVKEGLDGTALGETEIFPPRPTNGFVTFPTGLAWQESSDTFYFLERNSKTFVQMGPEGRIIRTFPHPSPPFQNFVFNLGVSVATKRGTLFITGSERYDFRVTKVMEMTLDGVLTGVEIPLENLGATVTGIAVRGDDLVAVGTGAFSELFRLKAFPQPSSTFVRGDVDTNGTVNLTDVIIALNYLFRGGASPMCEDAADADDSGQVNVTDAIAILLSLFRGAGPLPAPYPESGFDPTPDGLACS